MSEQKKPETPTPSPSQDKAEDYEQKEQQIRQIIQAHAAYSGPIPHPALLEHFERVLPGSADRIIGMAERQSDHRQELERRQLKSEILNSFLGILFAFLLGLATVGGGVYCIVTGHGVAGTIIGGAGLTSLVSVFIYGTQARVKEKKEEVSQGD